MRWVAAVIAGAASSVSAPRSVRIEHRVTVYASGRVARDIATGDSVGLMLQPVANRGGNGYGAVPKFRAVVIGGRVRVVFRWPPNDNHCFGASNCVQTPWHVGSRVDITVCAQSPQDIIDSCGRATTTVVG